MRRSTIAIVAFVVAILSVSPEAAFAQEAAPASETSVIIFNTLLMFACSLAAILVVAGLSMLEAGYVRTKNAASICLQKIVGAAIALIMTWLVGFNLVYGVETGGFLGNFTFWTAKDLDPVGQGSPAAAAFLQHSAYAVVAASIGTSALAERLRLSAHVVFSILFAGLIFPIAASWDWGRGYLEAQWKFLDFAGASLVHASAGAAALAGAIILGPRRGKYDGRRVTPLVGSNLPLAASGALLFSIGWIILIAGGERSIASVGDAISISTAILNANIGAAGGVLAAMIMSALIYQRVDLTIVLNAAIGGLVSLSADPVSPAVWQAALIGAMGGVIVTAGVPLLDRVRIDDVAGVIPAHLFCGLWGTLIIAWTNSEVSFPGQLFGAVMVAGFVFIMSALVWTALRFSIGARAAPEQEAAGLDRAELGLEAYPEFRRS